MDTPELTSEDIEESLLEPMTASEYRYLARFINAVRAHSVVDLVLFQHAELTMRFQRLMERFKQAHVSGQLQADVEDYVRSLSK